MNKQADNCSAVLGAQQKACCAQPAPFRNHLRGILALLLGVLTAFAVSAGAAAPAYAATTGTTTLLITGVGEYDLASDVLDEINAQRSRAGVPNLVMDEELLSAAAYRAADLSVSYGSSCANGDSYQALSEKASCQLISFDCNGRSAKEIVDQWMSAGRSALLSNSYKSIGVGVFSQRNDVYWAVFLGTDAADPVPNMPPTDEYTWKVDVKGLNTDRLDVYCVDGDKVDDEKTISMSTYRNSGNNRLIVFDPTGAIWTSSNSAVATVDNEGIVTCHASGTVTITADFGAGLKDSYTVQVMVKESSGGQTQQPSTEGQQDGQGSEDKPSAGGSEQQTQVMHRLYNRWTGEHFYTASAEERDSLVKVGWTSEGTGWVAPTSGTPVYRLYNRYVPGGDHHYTTDAKERDALVRAGWTSEGTGWYSGGSVRVYRQYNPYAVTGTHNYTTDKHENGELVKLGWRAEGTGWYAVSAG